MKNARQLAHISMSRRGRRRLIQIRDIRSRTSPIGYVAEAIDLEVDVETGQIKLLNAICTIDVGKAINPQQLVGQIEGCMVQVMGHALMENLIQKDGQVLTKEAVHIFNPDCAGHPR